MRRPVDVPPARLGDGDAAHARRGVGAAQDYGCPIGTPVYAMFPVRRLAKTGGPNADGGHTLIGYADGRNYWVVQHLSAWQTTVSPNGQVARSGDSGTQVRGAHVHAYVVIDGVRMNPENYLAQLAGQSSTPFIPRSTKRRGGTTMAQYYRRAQTGEIGRFADGVKIFGSQKDYEAHREAVIAHAQVNPGPPLTIPPDSNKPNGFVNLDEWHWGIQIAVHGGTY